MNKSLLLFLVIQMAVMGFASNAHAKPEWASKFGVGCMACHTSNSGSGGNVRSAAWTAYRAGGLVPGLRDFVKASGANTKPVISQVALEWDAEVGQELKIPLSVFDEQQDSFAPLVKPANLGSNFSEEYTGDNNLPTVDFKWTPTETQANKVYSVSLFVKETDSVEKLKSVAVKVKIRVWPAGNRDQASVQKVLVSTSKWVEGALTLKGKVVLNKIMKASEKATFLGRSDFTVNVTQGVDGNGAAIASAVPVTFDINGGWSLSGISLPASPPFSCSLSVEFENSTPAVRKIVGAPKDCIKP